MGSSDGADKRTAILGLLKDCKFEELKKGIYKFKILSGDSTNEN